MPHTPYTFDDYHEILQSINQEQNLSVYFQKGKIISIIGNDSMMIIPCSTGSGQLTQLPQSIRENHVSRNRLVNIDPIHISAEL